MSPREPRCRAHRLAFAAMALVLAFGISVARARYDCGQPNPGADVDAAMGAAEVRRFGRRVEEMTSQEYKTLAAASYTLDNVPMKFHVLLESAVGVTATR